MNSHVFVYGTLKTGQLRESMWPDRPLQIRRAWTHGQLYDLGPYPALIIGPDRVAGQLWTFAPELIPLVLQTLDRIEGTNQPGEKNEYDRVLGHAHLDSGEPFRAWTYVYADQQRLSGLCPMKPCLGFDQQRYSIWPARSPWVPS